MKILHLADTHYDLNTSNLHYPDSKEMVIKLFDWLKKHKDDFDMIAISGDISVKGTSNIEELQYVKTQFEALDIPYIIIPGNHDLCPLKGMEKRYPGLEEYEYTSLEQTNFYKVFGETGVRYSKVINNIQFVGFAIRNNDPDNIINWLIQELDTPYEKVVFCHYPLIPTRSAGFCSTWDYSRIENTLGTLKNIIFDEKNKVLSYFCGHQHINSIIKVNKTFHIETASTVLGSCSYRIINIDERQISINTKFLISRTAWVGNLLLPDRSHDNEHITPDAYQRGTSNDLYLHIERESLK